MKTYPRVNTISSLEVVKRVVHSMGDCPEKVKVAWWGKFPSIVQFNL